jgi:hypothetical protein
MSHRVIELHYIIPIKNIRFVMCYGILSHEQASKLDHDDISLADVQDRRDKIQVGEYKLHQYSNLYFCARNPMMYKRRNQSDGLCVLQINRRVLNNPEVVLSDRNAASDYAKFYKSPEGLRHIDFDLVFAEYWTDPDQFEERRKKSIKCAEALIPHCVDARYIDGAYVANKTAEINLKNAGFNKPIAINAHIFFR